MNLNKIVEALLFASREPVDSKKIAKIIRKVSKREEADQELCSVKYTEIDEVFCEDFDGRKIYLVLIN